MLRAKGGIKPNCKVLLRQVLIQEGISAPSMLLPSLETGEQRLPRAAPLMPGCLPQAALPDRCGKAPWGGELLSSGACLESRPLYQKRDVLMCT